MPEARISTLAIGPDSAAEPISAEEARAELTALGLKLEPPYLLAVGNQQPRKNLVWLVEAFKVLVARRRDIELVIVGSRRYRGRTLFRL